MPDQLEVDTQLYFYVSGRGSGSPSWDRIAFDLTSPESIDFHDWLRSPHSIGPAGASRRGAPGGQPKGPEGSIRPPADSESTESALRLNPNSRMFESELVPVPALA